MTQDQWQVLAFKVVLVAAALSIFAWVVDYTSLAAGQNWRDPIGRTFMWLKALLLGLIFTSILSVFWNLNRYTSRAIGWLDVCMLAAISPVLVTRIRLFRRLFKVGRLPGGAIRELVCGSCGLTVAGQFQAVDWWRCPSCRHRNSPPPSILARPH